MKAARAARWLLGSLLGLLLLAVLLGAAVYGLLSTPRGSQLLLQQLPGLQAQGVRGALLGDFEAEQLQLKLASGEQLDLRGLRWHGLRWEGGRLLLDQLSLQRLHFAPSPTPSSSVPLREWRSPVPIDVAAIQVVELDIAGVLLQDLHASASLGDQHALRVTRLRWQQLHFAGEVQVDGAAPMQTNLALRVSKPDDTPLDGPAWRGHLRAQGPLAALQTTGLLEAEGQSLAFQGTVQPFQAWPLGAFELETHALDLAALHRAAPRTALEGEARLTPETGTTAAKARQQLHVRLSNPHVGRWDLGHLPVRDLVLDASFSPHDLKALRIDALQARLGGDARITGTGQVQQDGRWQLLAKLDDLQPERLDARLISGRLDGPVDLSGGGGQPLRLRFDLQGQGALTPLRLRALLTHEGERWRLDEGEALAAGGRATLSGLYDPAGDSTLTGRLADFDPARIWRGGLPAMRLNGSFDAQQSSARTAVQASLKDSRAAELPLSGDVTLQRTAAQAAWALQLQLKLGSAELAAHGQGSPEALSGHLRLDAPRLAELAPLHAQLAGLSGQAKLDTDLSLTRSAAGWQVQAAGQGEASALRWGEHYRADQLQASWKLPQRASNAPLSLDVQAKGLGLQGRPVSELDAHLDGRWDEHRLRLSAISPSPLAGRGDETLALQAEAQGGLAPDAPQWRGRLMRLSLAPLRPGTPPLLEARDLPLRLDAQGLEFSPGQADVAGARVAWQTLRWQQTSAGAEALLDLRLLPFDVAPLLARWQPDFGWTGDLRVGGSARWQWRAGRLDGDLLIERLGGDLRVQDDAGPLPLGLSDLRLAASHHDGVWRFAQGVAGQQLGNFVATQSITSPGPWPDAQSALDGVMQAQVDHLSRWGSWLPAGWRLGGRVNGLARLSGRLGAPLWKGQIEGDGLSVRHALQGVDVGDGRILLKLDGDKARLEQFEAHAGPGLITATGDADLGAKPRARLQLEAQRLQILGRADQRLIASGKAQLSLTPETLQLKGQLRADEGRFDFSRADAPSLADDVVVRRGPTLAAERTARRAPVRTTQVDLDVDFGDDFHVLGRGLETQLRGKLHLGQRDDKLVLTGKLQTHGGQYLAYGQRLDIEQGELVFTGPYDNPTLDVIATRPNTDTRVGVRVTGTALAPRAALFSEPELSETEKLSWLLLGRGSDGLGRTDAALLQRAAVALLTGEGGSGRSLRSLGLDELSVSRADDDTRTTIVRLGRQLSQRWYVGYERSLNATTGSWQLIYRIAQRFTLRAQSGDDNALDLIWQWRWN